MISVTFRHLKYVKVVFNATKCIKNNFPNSITGHSTLLVSSYSYSVNLLSLPSNRSGPVLFYLKAILEFLFCDSQKTSNLDLYNHAAVLQRIHGTSHILHDIQV